MIEYSTQKIFEICESYSFDRYFVGDRIPEKKIINARSKYPVPENVQILALIDTALWNSGKTGMAITDRGLYWYNGGPSSSEKSSISWEEFSEVIIWSSKEDRIEIGDKSYFFIYPRINDKVTELLEEIQFYLLGYDDEDEDEYDDLLLDDDEDEDNAITISLSFDDSDDDLTDSSTEWMIAIAGQQYGPYQLDVIRDMVQTGQIQPATTHVWTAGMANWVEFLQQPEMAALVRPQAPAMPPVPPPPPVQPAPPAQPALDALFAEPVQAGNSSVDGSLIDFNQATEEQLQELPGIGIIGAKRIVQERGSIGGFQSAEQVGELLGLKPHQVNKLKSKAVFRPITITPIHRGGGRMVDY
ncbi:hypothetical protein J40TS1_33360 [Paenibacillus montaniterrae]|uniref:GYF domain-containing protein n=1 Tax=Paenibacillus montaniterrae TaxID=429341 RepID=A0A920D070_9BACL|nr:helix-hairpin-helix domain-containing protein [Paenibacillus montaniterrae]GIP17694.1 hypothetical protein J40TS1_33360 [Paenibacillus montaniterrae]